MKIKPKKILLTAAILLTIIFGCELLEGQSNLFLESYLKSLENEVSPEYKDGFLVLTYRGNVSVRWVGVRFAHEDYRIFHLYKRNPNNIFFLLYPLPEEEDKLKYRIVVDGLWMKDPTNDLYETDEVLGVSYSLFEVEEKPLKKIINPVPGEDSTLLFVFQGLPRKDIYIVGDFNNWNPYKHRLKEDSEEPGFYSISMRTGPGRYYYHFLVEGVPVPDPYNRNRALGSNGILSNYFDVYNR